MRFCDTVAILLTAFVVWPLSAANTRVQLFAVEKTSQPLCRGGQLHALPRCAGSGCGDRAAVIAPWRFREGSAEVELPLSAEDSWEIVIGGSGCWAPPLIVAAGNSGETRTAFVWPAAAISGALAIAKGEAPPRELHAMVQAGDARTIGAVIPETSLECALNGVNWRCIIPATSVDLRLAAEGFVPRYFWGFEVPAGQQKTMEVALARGASVSGLVALADRRAPPEGVAVELRPAGYAGTPSDERRIAVRSHVTKPNSRGFFQFSTVGEGVYDVVATKKGWSRAIRRVRVVGSKESDAGVLTLPPLARAEVVIDPPLDLKGRRWRVLLDRDVIATQPLAPLADKQAAPDGTWALEGVEAGKYRLDVYDGAGVAFERLIVNVQPNGAPLRLHMEGIVGRGVLRAGDEPLAADLRFLQEGGSGDVHLVSGDDGTFAGTFPAPGNYSVEIVPRSTEQRLHTKAAVRPNADGVVQLDIELPGGVVRGTVIDEDGKAVAGFVRLFGDKSSMMTTLAKDDGTFRFVGVNPGEVTLNAKAREAGDSGPVGYTVVDKESELVTLTLHPSRKVTMWVVSPRGEPVAGAIIRYTLLRIQREVITGPAGDARFDVPRGVDAVELVIVAAGFPSRVVRLAVTPEMELNPQVVLGSTAATLIVQVGNAPPWPLVRRNGTDAGPHWLPEFFSSPMGGPTFSNKTSRGFEFEVDPGNYTFCPGRGDSSKCIQKSLSAGTETVVDVTSWSAEP